MGGGRLKMDNPARFLIVVGLVFAIFMLGALIFFNPDPNNYTHPVNVTIREKYAQYEYTASCGKTMCTQTEETKVVDSNGNLYPIQDEVLWAKLEINKSYVFNIGDLPTTRGQVLSIEGV